MPFFHSSRLRDPKSSAKAAAPQRGLGRRQSSGSRLVWHSGTGAGSGKRPQKAPSSKGNAAAKKSLTVHFSRIEVQPFHFDWGLADAVFYSREELAEMGQSRFADAASLRQTRNPNWGKEGAEPAGDIASQLAAALGDPDADEGVSIRGIEHFVYPDLQQEMIRRKKEVQREVLEHSRSRKPDPHGWRLAKLSKSLSQWARDVALEKATKYGENNAAMDPEENKAAADPETTARGESSDELEGSQRSLRGGRTSAGMSKDAEVGAGRERGTSDDAEVGAGKLAELNERPETQAAGAGTGED